MKEIVNGELYDTDAAKCCGKWESTQDPASPDYCALTLFKKSNGGFFLSCCGAGRDRYIFYVTDDPTVRAKSIIPLDPGDAMGWAEDHLSGDEYADAFGEVFEDDGHVSMYLLLSLETAAWAQKAAASAGISISAYVEKLITADTLSA